MYGTWCSFDGGWTLSVMPVDFVGWIWITLTLFRKGRVTDNRAHFIIDTASGYWSLISFRVLLFDNSLTATPKVVKLKEKEKLNNYIFLAYICMYLFRSIYIYK